MRSTLFWTSMIIGFLLVYLFQSWEATKKEHFADITKVPKSSIYNEMTNTNTNFVETFPANDKLYVYLSSFSRINNANATIYDANTGTWKSMVNVADFILRKSKDSQFPTSLEGATNLGLPMSGISLNGPSSDNFGTPDTFQLPSFSVAFYMKWNNLDIGKPVSLFELYAESPNHVSLQIEKRDTANAVITAVLGDEYTQYSWNVPVTTVTSNGNDTLYTFTYSTITKDIILYLGTTGIYKKTLQTNPRILLGNSKFTINENTYMDATLYAFAYWKNVALTQDDIVKLNSYMMKQVSGTDAILDNVNTQIMEATEKRLVAEQQLTSTTETLNILEQELAMCKSIMEQNKPKDDAEFTPVDMYSKWKVNVNYSPADVDPTDLQKCGILTVSKYGSADQKTSVTATKT